MLKGFFERRRKEREATDTAKVLKQSIVLLHVVAREREFILFTLGQRQPIIVSLLRRYGLEKPAATIEELDLDPKLGQELIPTELVQVGVAFKEAAGTFRTIETVDALGMLPTQVLQQAAYDADLLKWTMWQNFHGNDDALDAAMKAAQSTLWAVSSLAKAQQEPNAYGFERAVALDQLAWIQEWLPTPEA